MTYRVSVFTCSEDSTGRRRCAMPYWEKLREYCIECSTHSAVVLSTEYNAVIVDNTLQNKTNGPWSIEFDSEDDFTMFLLKFFIMGQKFILQIFGADRYPLSHWSNLHEYCAECSRGVFEVLRTEYNAAMGVNPPSRTTGYWHIEFATENDRTMFLLRFS